MVYSGLFLTRYVESDLESDREHTSSILGDDASGIGCDFRYQGSGSSSPTVRFC